MATYPELSGKVAAISGATGNLGQAVVRRFRAEGAKLVLIDHNPDKIQKFIQEQNLGDSAFAAPVDLGKKVEVDAIVKNALAHFGHIDILVNTAGGYRPSVPVIDLPEEQWDSLIDLNAKTMFLLSAAVARSMVEKEIKGRIVNIAGRAALKGSPTLAAYSVGKSGALRLTEAMSAELLDRDITVNAVLPSTIDTPQNRQGEPGADFSKWISPDSLADVIVFLASDGARDITGAAIPVYGKS